jgi:hypothetical protein
MSTKPNELMPARHLFPLLCLQCHIELDAGSAVQDADWSPHSGTTLAAVTAAGRAVVWDLSRDLHAPICSQKASQTGYVWQRV